MADTHLTLRFLRELIETARREAELFGLSTDDVFGYWARLGCAFEAARGATTERVRQALQGRLAIETMSEFEQELVFDGMLDAYTDPPAVVMDRLAGIAERTRKALNGGDIRQDAT